MLCALTPFDMNGAILSSRISSCGPPLTFTYAHSLIFAMAGGCSKPTPNHHPKQPKQSQKNRLLRFNAFEQSGLLPTDLKEADALAAGSRAKTWRSAAFQSAAVCRCRLLVYLGPPCLLYTTYLRTHSLPPLCFPLCHYTWHASTTQPLNAPMRSCPTTAACAHRHARTHFARILQKPCALSLCVRHRLLCPPNPLQPLVHKPLFHSAARAQKRQGQG